MNDTTFVLIALMLTYAAGAGVLLYAVYRIGCTYEEESHDNRNSER